MKNRIAWALVAALIVAPAIYSHFATANEGDKKFTATCPMSGGPAKEENFVEYKGKKVYFCCKNCPKAFEKDPDAVAAKVILQFLETAQATQVGCPVSGAKLNPETAVAVGNAKVAFCCNNCKGKYEKASDDDKLAMLFGKASKGFTLQTVCPVSKKPINPQAVAEHDGKKVYFCCENCPKAFNADPAKFIAELPQFAK